MLFVDIEVIYINNCWIVRELYGNFSRIELCSVFKSVPNERTLDVSASYLQLYCVAELYSLGLSLGKRNNKVVYSNAFTY